MFLFIKHNKYLYKLGINKIATKKVKCDFTNKQKQKTFDVFDNLFRYLANVANL